MPNIPDLLNRFDRQAPEIRLGSLGLSSEQMLSHPIPGTWSVQQLVLHLADADWAFIDRMRRIIAEDNPTYQAWDQDKFTERLFYEEQSVQDAVVIIELGRRQLMRVLRKLGPEAFARTGRHSERGRQTLGDVLEYAVTHVDHHMKFLLEKRKKMGK